MTAEIVVRPLALGAVLLGGRGSGPRGLVISGGLLAVAILGLSPAPLPEPLRAGLGAFAFTAAAALTFGPAWPPLVAEAAFSGAALALPAAAWAAFLLRHLGLLTIAAGVAGTLAVVSLFAADASRANADAGWRRGALWAEAILLPAALSASLAWGHVRFGETRRGESLAAALLVALLAWFPAAILESVRVRRELAEEVRLGLLPEEDATALRFPWRRRLEKRFGRPDERREYVRSALLLASARQQQRRRSGEAERLRQLEILAFRTRIRRVLAARAERNARRESGEVPLDARSG